MPELRTFSGKGKVSIFLGATVVTILVGLAYGSTEKRPPPNSSKMIPSGRSAPLLPGDTSDIVATGHVTTPKKDLVSVGSDFSGLVEKVFVDVNDTVHKGELLAIFDDREIAARIREERARVREARAQLVFAKKEWKRGQILSHLSFQTLEQKDKNKKNIVVSESRLEEARAHMARLKEIEAKAEIRSPLNGILLARLTNPGEEKVRGAILFTVANLSHLQILAEVAEFDTGRIRINSTVLITADGYPGISWNGRVIKIPHRVVPQRTNPEDPSAPVDIRTFNVRISPVDLLPLPLGQRVQVRFPGANGP